MRNIRGEGTDWFKLTGQLCYLNKVVNLKKKASNLEAEVTIGSTSDSQEEESEPTEDTG